MQLHAAAPSAPGCSLDAVLAAAAKMQHSRAAELRETTTPREGAASAKAAETEKGAADRLRLKCSVADLGAKSGVKCLVTEPCQIQKGSLMRQLGA